jgi:amino acid adenylation domain-containing protein
LGGLLEKSELRLSLITEAWSTVFESPIQIEKSYFANGGDSIQAIRFLSKLKEMGAQVDLSSLLNSATIKQWDFEITTNNSPELSIITEPRIFPLTEMQHKIWSHYQAFKDQGAYHEQFLFELKVAPDIDILNSCINALWLSYPNLRIRIKTDNQNELVQEIIDQDLKIQMLSFDSIQDALNYDQSQHFKEELLRLSLLSVNSKTYLLWSHHHVILDGWSVGILIREFIERINSNNFHVSTHRNYQFLLYMAEQEFSPLRNNKASFPFSIPIQMNQPNSGFESIAFKDLRVNREKENQIIQNLQVTRQLLCCGITGVVLRSIGNESKFFFNGISSGRDFLSGHIDEAVGLFIRNINISINVDEATTWKRFLNELNNEFQSNLSVKNRHTQVDSEASNSDFLFVYENYPYTDIQSEAIVAQLVEVTEITGYPITFCVFPKENSYEFRIVYDARIIGHEFVKSFVFKYEQLYQRILACDLVDFIIDTNNRRSNVQPILAIDALDVKQIESLQLSNSTILFNPGKAFNELFNDVFPKYSHNEIEGIHWWKNQLFNSLPGKWNDDLILNSTLECKFSCEVNGSPSAFLEKLTFYLKQSIWPHSDYEINFFHQGCIYPLHILEAHINLAKQIAKAEEFKHLFTSIFKEHWNPKSNMLIAFDDIKNLSIRYHFDVVFQFISGDFSLFTNSSVSEDFVHSVTSFFGNGVTPIPKLSLTDSLKTTDQCEFWTIIQRFDDSVAITPNLKAIVDEETSLSFKELDTLSDKIATYISSTESKDSNFIGIQLTRSRYQIASILAILKLGKAFVPFDINWPLERINLVANQANIALIIDQEYINTINTHVISINKQSIQSKLENDTAYALFTSGSTGVPKGCEISEEAFNNYLSHCGRIYFSNQKNCNIHVFTPLTFDFTLTSVLGGLLYGQTLILHPEHRNTYESLKIALLDDQSEFLKLTPSHITLAEKEWFIHSTSKLFVVGGEALLESQTHKCLFNTTHRVINEYGPTEATVGCVFEEVILENSPLIGYPIEGMGVMVINEHEELLPIGHLGELCLFGKGLAKGYLNNVSQTKKQFIHLRNDPSKIIYKTGDLVCMQHNGKLRYIARIDNQVKLNGYRIETEEISTLIHSNYGIESHSLVIENGQSKQLVTFTERIQKGNDIKGLLNKILPQYMVPSHIVEMEELPITPNGKVDIDKLKSSYFKLINKPNEESVSFENTLATWNNLKSILLPVLNEKSILIDGWKPVESRIHYLSSLQRTQLQILTPTGADPVIVHWIEEINKQFTYEENTNHIQLSANQLLEFVEILDTHQLNLIEYHSQPLLRTLKNLQKKKGISPLQINSHDIPFLSLDTIALISDWTFSLNFPIIGKKNETGNFYLLLPNGILNKTFSNIGDDQPMNWSGSINGLETNEFEFVRTTNGLFAQRKTLVERFSNCIKLSTIEAILFKNINSVTCIYAHLVDNELSIFIQSSNANTTAYNEALIQSYLPSWCSIKEIIVCEHIITALKTWKSKFNSSEFSLFLDKNIPEYKYLNGDYSLIQQGGDSITALRIVGKLKSRGYAIEVGDLLNATNISTYLLSLVRNQNVLIQTNGLQLTPIQHWFLTDFPGNKNHFNQSILLELLIPVNPQALQNALQSCLGEHQILSQVYLETWSPGLAPTVELIQCENEEEVSQHCARMQASFDITKGPVAGAAIVTLHEKVLLFICIHHLYCDGYTWRIILDDLQTILQGNQVLKRESASVFGKIRTQFLNLSQSQASDSLAFYGTTIFNPFQDLEPYSYKSSNYLAWEWSKEQTTWFQYTTEIGQTANEKFLYLFLASWLSIYDQPATIFFETHGRFYEGIPELTDTIGWFTQFYPMFCQHWPTKVTLKADIAAEFERLPLNGLTYMGNPSWQKPPFPVLLNYLGNFDENRGSIAIPSAISQGDMTDINNPVFGMVELNALIIEGKMQWMLRMHPTLDPTPFKEALNATIQQTIKDNAAQTHIDESIDDEDRNAIEDLLNDL